MNTKSIDKEVFYNVTGEAVTAAYNYLNALGYFTTPTNEGRRVENLLIQARCQEMDVKRAINGTYGKGYNPDAMEELYKALEGVLHQFGGDRWTGLRLKAIKAVQEALDKADLQK